MELGYAISVPTFALLDNTLSATEKLMYTLLCGYANRQGYCTVSNDVLAVALRFKDNGVVKQLSDGVIDKMLGHLNELGYVQVQKVEGVRTIIVTFQKQELKVEIKVPAHKKPTTQAKLGNKELALAVLDHLSQACIARGYKRNEFKGVKSNLDPILGRLNEGHTFDECISVINVKFEDDYFKENPKYLSPQTLFRPTNFERYLLEASSIKDIEKKIVTKHGLKLVTEKVEADTNQEEVSF